MDIVRKILKKPYLVAKSAMVDLYVNANGTPRISLRERIGITWRYRLASKFGVFLTDNERRLGTYRNIHKDQRCFIIGNGPSLNSLDLTLLKSEVTFGVNAIYTNFEKMGFYPTYYVVEDIFVAEDRSGEINNFHGSTKFFGNYLQYCLKPDENTIWLNVQFRYEDRNKYPNFSKDALRCVWTGGTVTYLSLQLAYYMGFREVYMVGFDHNYDIPKDVKMEGTEILSLGDDVNHFNKDYFGKGKRWHDPMVDRMEKSYFKAKEVYHADLRKIFNATAGGKLEVFDRVDYNSLF